MGTQNVLASQAVGRVVAQGVYPGIEGVGNQREDQAVAGFLPFSFPHLSSVGRWLNRGALPRGLGEAGVNVWGH